MAKVLKMGNVVFRVSDIVVAFIPEDQPKSVVIYTRCSLGSFSFNFPTEESAHQRLDELQEILKNDN